MSSVVTFGHVQGLVGGAQRGSFCSVVPMLRVGEPLRSGILVSACLGRAGPGKSAVSDLCRLLADLEKRINVFPFAFQGASSV